ncbi:tyrosine-protein phosphatase [Facklamia sp. P13055]|uniref:tyrosine-protein phosphatase n=1 Tax=unclassified Facklamia TaxID=2622293 RepID=UPI003D175E15
MIVDLHSHLIPGVDDGAQTLEDSIYLAKMGQEEGVQHIVLTPHHRNGQFINHKEDVIKFTDKLSADYERAGLQVKVYPGQEIRLTKQFMEDYYNGDLLSLDGSDKYYLIEFPTAKVPEFAPKMLLQLIDMGITPLIAHPERNHQLAENYEDLYDLIQMGCLSQITSSSYVGLYGEKFQKTAREMIELNLAHVIASDVHHVDFRPFNMKAAFNQLEQDFGQAKVDYFLQNARDIFNGDPIHKLEAKHSKSIRKKKKRFFGLF